MRPRSEEYYPNEFSRSSRMGNDYPSRRSSYEDPWYYRAAESRSSELGWRDNRGKAPRSYKRSDQRIMEDIFEAVSAEMTLDSSDVEINITNGEVVLSGNVRDRRDKWRIEDLVENISGVTHIENRIRITSEARSPYGNNPEDPGNTDTQLRSFVDNISSR